VKIKSLVQVPFCAWIFLGVALASSSTFAQEAVTYHSETDNLLTIEKVSVLPFTDNLQGIFARPLEAHFTSLVEKMHRWDYVPANTSGALLAPEELEESPDKAKQIGGSLGSDGFFVSRVTKGPNGVTIHLSLFLSKDGKLLSQAILKDYKQFSLPDLKEQMQRLLSEIVSRLPYSGRLLSREGNRITINLGLRDGLQPGQVLSVIQIIQAKRHPKFNFLISTEKEIFGKIKVLKVDETLSFGTIISEKEKGAIQKNSKVGALDFVSYSNHDTLSLNPTPEEELAQREDGRLAFGKDAKEWRPVSTPMFGQIGGRLGLASVTHNSEVSSGGLSASDSMAPVIGLEGEIWVTEEWTFFAKLKQGIAQFNNPRGGAQPQKLNQSISAYEAGFGYRFRFGPYVWSPYAEPFLGYFTQKLNTDTSSPQAYNSMDYSGFKLGARGATPIGDGQIYGMGAEFSMAFQPRLSEAPYTSGSSKNNVTQFGLFGYKKMSERLKATVQLDFEMLSSTFGGGATRTDPSSSTSERIVSLTAGAYYMF